MFLMDKAGRPAKLEIGDVIRVTKEKGIEVFRLGEPMQFCQHQFEKGRIEEILNMTLPGRDDEEERQHAGVIALLLTCFAGLDVLFPRGGKSDFTVCEHLPHR